MALALALAVAPWLSGQAVMPSAPPLPESGWPDTETATKYARLLMESISPSRLAQDLAKRPEQVPPTLRTLGSALMTTDVASSARIAAYLAAAGIAHAKRVPQPIATDDLRLLIGLQLVDPYRYQQEAAFRARVNANLPRSLDLSTPRAVREAAATELNRVAPIDFDTAESMYVAWKLAPRESTTRRLSWEDRSLAVSDDLAGPIEASLFSFPSDIVSLGEAERFLGALRATAPRRRIVVLTDAQTKARFSLKLGVDVIDSFERPFTAWPRDPFLVTRTPRGGVVFVNRPNMQPGREEDANLVRALIHGLPRAADEQWQEPRWTVAPVPFHNGHALILHDAVWISIHTVEIRALEILGLTRVPVETFDTEAGIRRYVEAAQQAARELETVYGRPVRFVHRLPNSESLPAQIALMQRLGGGGGFDLDSLVTLLPGKNGRKTALIGDIALGATLAREAPGQTWKTAAAAYGFNGKSSTLGKRIAEAQKEPRAAALQLFLDEVSTALATQGWRVRRLPLLNVPYSLLSDPSTLTGTAFLLTWNNVVLEKVGDTRRAAGFESLFAPADALARKLFASAGYELQYLPPLTRSILLNGGYRCASSHVRP